MHISWIEGQTPYQFLVLLPTAKEIHSSSATGAESVPRNVFPEKWDWQPCSQTVLLP